MATLREANRRHAQVCTDRLWLLRERFQNGKSKECLDDLHDDWPTIETARRWASAELERDDTAARLCIDLNTVAAQLLDLYEAPVTRIQWLTAGLAAAESLGDLSAQCAQIG